MLNKIIVMKLHVSIPITQILLSVSTMVASPPWLPPTTTSSFRLHSWIGGGVRRVVALVAVGLGTGQEVVAACKGGRLGA